MKIKFITLNLWQGGNLFTNILKFLDSEQPDILALQEVYNGTNSNYKNKYRSLEILKKKLPLPYSHFAPAFLDNKNFGKIIQGNAVFSRWPIVDTNITFFDQPYREDYIEKTEKFPFIPRNLQHAIIKNNNILLNIFNTQGIWDTHGEDNPRRIQMGKTIAQQIKNKSNVILAGDLNVKPHTKSIAQIDKYLNNIFIDDLKTTFNLIHKKEIGFASAAVDMIFISPNIKIIKKECSQANISDHLSLITELEI